MQSSVFPHINVVGGVRRATLNGRLVQIRQLAYYGIGETDFDRILANCRGSSMKTNPVVLNDAEITGILRERL